MTRRFAYGAAAGVLVAAFASAAFADPIVYYTAPRMLKQGTASTPLAGDGKVVVKVLVNADGTFKVQSILSSTNHGDDAAALEIAKTSTYAPATKGSKKLLAFYDYTLNFKGGSASDVSGGGSGGGASTGELGKYENELRAADYSSAQAGLKAYVAAHPGDAKGELDLGVADTYLKDYAGGAEAFDKAGTIPAGFKQVAAKAYVENAVALLLAKNVTDGLPAAKKAAAFAPGFASDDTLGVAQLESGDAASAVTALQKAHDEAKSDPKITTNSRVANDLHLTQAYYANGDQASAQKSSAEATSLDPKASAGVAASTANYFALKAQDAGKAGKYAESGDLYEQAAQADPSQAVTLYVNASFSYLKVLPNADSAKAKDAADKALAIDPNSASANYAEGISLANVGKKTDATAALNKAATLAKASGDTTLGPEIDRALKQMTSGGSGDSSQ